MSTLQGLGFAGLIASCSLEDEEDLAHDYAAMRQAEACEWDMETSFEHDTNELDIHIPLRECSSKCSLESRSGS